MSYKARQGKHKVDVFVIRTVAVHMLPHLQVDLPFPCMRVCGTATKANKPKHTLYGSILMKAQGAVRTAIFP